MQEHENKKAFSIKTWSNCGWLMVVKPSDPSLVERLKKVFSPLMIYGFLKNEMKYYHHVEASTLWNYWKFYKL